MEKEVKKGDKVVITFCPDEKFIGKRGEVIRVVKALGGTKLYKIKSGGRVIRDYAARDCFELIN